jgi:hypothetical protein
MTTVTLNVGELRIEGQDELAANATTDHAFGGGMMPPRTPLRPRGGGGTDDGKPTRRQALALNAAIVAGALAIAFAIVGRPQ